MSDSPTDVERSDVSGTGAQRTGSPLSTASMWFAISGFVLGSASLGIPSIVAVVLGHMAASREPHGRPRWLAGLVLGYIGLGIAALLTAFIVGFLFFAKSASYNG